MGKGIDIARSGAPEHAALLDDFKDQLLIVFLRRLEEKYGDDLKFPVTEVDATGDFLLAFSVSDRIFHFELRKKS